MDMTAEIAELRVEAESMMTDRCVITRTVQPTTAPVLNPATGLYPDIPAQVIYTGSCSLRVPGMLSAGRMKTSAGDIASLLIAVVAIPAGSPNMKVQDVVLFTDSEFDPSLIGTLYRVSGLWLSSHVTKQRATVEAVAD